MDGLNRVILLGNLGSDAELNTTSGGRAVLKMRLATSESYNDSSGNRQTRTEWHNVTLWGKVAQSLGAYLVKGKRVLVEGRLQYSTYEGRDGNKRYRTDIVATNIVLQGGTTGTTDPAPAPKREQDDDIPF